MATQHSVASLGVTAVLRQVLISNFTRAELEIACNDLGVNPELIRGMDEGLEYWADQFITYFARRGRIQDLIGYARLQRPTIAWNQISQLASNAPFDENIGAPLVGGLEALIQLIQRPELRDIATEFQSHFRSARDQIRIVADHKDLHDQLHELEVRCYRPILKGADRFPDDELFNDNLTDYTAVFQSVINTLPEILARPSQTAAGGAWVQRLLEAWATLQSAIDTPDKSRLMRALRLIKSVIDLQPALVNQRLADSARQVRLQDLLNTVSTLQRKVSLITADIALLAQFSHGVDALARLSVSLPAAVAEHDRWQEVDNELKLVEDSPDASLDAQNWAQLRDLLVPLHSGRDEAWAAQFQKLVNQLADAVGSGQPRKVREAFRPFRSQAMQRFFDVDKKLKLMCDSLRESGAPLNALLSVLKGDSSDSG